MGVSGWLVWQVIGHPQVSWFSIAPHVASITSRWLQMVNVTKTVAWCAPLCRQQLPILAAELATNSVSSQRDGWSTSRMHTGLFRYIQETPVALAPSPGSRQHARAGQALRSRCACRGSRLALPAKLPRHDICFTLAASPWL